MDRQPVGSKKWRTAKWKRLLELVLPALKELPVFPSGFGVNFMDQGVNIAIKALESMIAQLERQ
ncbi:MAG: hypothetical protein KAR07_06955 [Spirochaetes bacterium]|nr:hypothetical protein [Spirochaetota bacterium]